MANLIGKELGKYRVTERIGRGGMAEVYLGVHTMLDRPVAIKVLHGYLTEDLSFIERFKREAKSVANLRHPNIVQVHDFDIYEDMLFMVMEYIGGSNLHERLVALEREGKRLPIRQVGSIINDIACALDYAHTQGMLHRDVKPSNILLDANGKAYLTDFGIARILSDHKLTATGTMLGTPAYMSPEQGRGDELTEESDIYSLGIVAFEMLTGQVPYDARTPIAIVNKQITAPVPAISSLVDGMPATAQDVIDRALAKSPDSRYSSAAELVVALRIALHALESAEMERQEVPPDAEAEERAAAPTVAPSAKVGAGEDTLSASTVAMSEPDLDKSTVAMPEADADHATVAMEGPALDKETVAMESEEIPPSQKTTKVSKEKLAPSPAGKKKMPLWAWIVIGAVLLGGAAFAITQFLPGREAAETPAAEVIVAEVEESTPKPQSEESEPGEVVFDAENMDGGLTLRVNEDADVEVVRAGENQETAWRTGNGQVLPAVDGNGERDAFIMFDIDNDFLFECSDPALQVQIEVEYLDEGTGFFILEYDAQSGGPFGDGRYKEAEVIQKTNSGEFKTAVFKLDDALFGDRLGPADSPSDIRIFDNNDGAETFRRVTVKLRTGASETAAEDTEVPSPEPTEDIPAFITNDEVFFDTDHTDEGLYIRLNGDADAELVLAGEDQESAWRTGNGQVLKTSFGNNDNDWFLKFDVDDRFLHQVPEGVEIQIEIEYLDEGYDRFNVEYDAVSGGPNGDGTFKLTEEIRKTNSGEFKTAIFTLTDAYFANRTHHDGDFRITDLRDGAETIRRVTVKLRNGERYFLEGKRLREEGETEEAVKYFTLAIEAGIEGAHVYKGRGQAYHELEQNVPCIDDFSVYISLVPDDPTGVLWRGQCYDGLKQLDLATRDYVTFLDMTDGVAGFEEDREKYRVWLYGE